MGTWSEDSRPRYEAIANAFLEGAWSIERCFYPDEKASTTEESNSSRGPWLSAVPRRPLGCAESRSDVRTSLSERPWIVPANTILSKMIRSGCVVSDQTAFAVRASTLSLGKGMRTESGIKEKFDSLRGGTMLDLRQVFSLTDFLRNHKEMVARITETHKPVVLTVKGKPSLVIHDADSYQEIMDRLESAEGRAEKPWRT
jgi:prevent-host-death family protein